MQAFRHLVAQRHLAVLICAAALLVKLLVPAGYMIATDHGRIAITICPGVVPSVAMPVDMHAMHGAMTDHALSDHGSSEHDGSKDHGKAEMPCAFAGLTAATLGAVDPIQLAALIAFILAVALFGTRPPAPSSPAYLRPPLRGPPATL